MGIRIYLQSAPWALPTALILAVALVPLLVRRRILVYLLCLAVGGFLAVTVTPNPRGGTARTLSWTVDVPTLRDLASTVDQSGLNALIAAPMAFLAALLAVRHRTWVPVVVVVLVPPLAEGVQWLVPPLHRVAFYLGDVTANWTGVVVGAVVGTAVGLLSRSFPRRAA